MTALLAALRKCGWNVTESDASVRLLPDDVRARYPSVPAAVTNFLERLEVCHNADENVWFLTPADFRSTDADGFRWNEYELMALEGAEGDTDRQAEIRAFWDHHLPVMMAVHSEYDYLAVRLAEPNPGAIVHGSAPEWDETSDVAPSFESFLQRFAAEAVSADPEYPFNVFM